jgi:hypothetical protein
MPANGPESVLVNMPFSPAEAEELAGKVKRLLATANQVIDSHNDLPRHWRGECSSHGPFAKLHAID